MGAIYVTLRSSTPISSNKLVHDALCQGSNRQRGICAARRTRYQGTIDNIEVLISENSPIQITGFAKDHSTERMNGNPVWTFEVTGGYPGIILTLRREYVCVPAAVRLVIAGSLLGHCTVTVSVPGSYWNTPFAGKGPEGGMTMANVPILPSGAPWNGPLSTTTGPQGISKICYLGTTWASLSRVGRRETKCESHQISVVSPSLTDLPVKLGKLPLRFGFHQ